MSLINLMHHDLAQALRERNLNQTRAIILQLQQRMNTDRVANLLWDTIECLAWQEGDQPAIRWITQNSPLTLKRNLPLR